MAPVAKGSARAIAIRVVCQARDCGVSRAYHDEQIEQAVDSTMWFPAYRGSAVATPG